MEFYSWISKKTLEYFGICSHALEWFKSYLLDRFQMMYTNGVLSVKAPGLNTWATFVSNIK